MLTINGGPASAMRSVIGTTSDGHFDNTLFGLAHRENDHTHNAEMVIPTLNAGITVISCVAAWTLGAKISLGTSVIALDFDFHFMNVESMSDVDTHEFHLFKGATTGAGTAISQVRTVKSANQDSQPAVPLITPLMVANQKTFIRMANLAGAASTAIITINYHAY